jgi:hypothetical protein
MILSGFGALRLSFCIHFGSQFMSAVHLLVNHEIRISYLEGIPLPENSD